MRADAAGLLSGEVQLHSHGVGTTEPSARSMWSVQHHAEACRAVTFLQGGAKLLSCSLDQSVAVMDVEVDGAVSWQHQNAHAAGINACHVLPDEFLGLIATGDDDGAVKLWDVRQRQVCLKVSRAMLCSSVPLCSSHMIPTGGCKFCCP